MNPTKIYGGLYYGVVDLCTETDINYFSKNKDSKSRE